MNINEILLTDTPNAGRQKINAWMETVKEYLTSVHGPDFEILHDANGDPVGLFRRVARTLYTHANGFAETTTPHPAFLVDGSYVDDIWVAVVQMSVVDENGNLLTDTNPSSSDGLATPRTGAHTHTARAYPGVDPCVKGDWDWFKLAADNLNTGGISGYHMISDMEWSLLALLEGEHYQNGGAWAPGNCDHGRDIDRPDIVGLVTESGQVADGSHPSRIACASMARANFLGIYDLKGNVWEWTHGMKIEAGVLKCAGNTNSGPTGPGNSFEAAEVDWYNTAINVTTGMSSGNRITSLRTDIPGLVLAATSDGAGHANYDFAGYWFNASGERMPLRGGDWGVGVRGGSLALNLSNVRSTRNWGVGSRLAFIGDLSAVT